MVEAAALAAERSRTRRSRARGSQIKDPHRYKTVLCQNFVKEGTCPYGTKCQFAHGKHELRKRAEKEKKQTADNETASHTPCIPQPECGLLPECGFLPEPSGCRSSADCACSATNNAEDDLLALLMAQATLHTCATPRQSLDNSFSSSPILSPASPASPAASPATNPELPWTSWLPPLSLLPSLSDVQPSTRCDSSTNFVSATTRSPTECTPPLTPCSASCLDPWDLAAGWHGGSCSARADDGSVQLQCNRITGKVELKQACHSFADRHDALGTGSTVRRSLSMLFADDE